MFDEENGDRSLLIRLDSRSERLRQRFQPNSKSQNQPKPSIVPSPKFVDYSILNPKIKSRQITMPYVNIQITQGATRSQKAQLVKEVTDSLVKILGKKPEHTHIVIQEIADENWGFSGLLTDDWKQQQSPSIDK